MSHVGATAGAARRRRERRLRMHWRHEQLSLQMLLATFQHHSAPRGQTTARSGERVRGEVYGQVPGAPPPQAAGAQFFAMDVDEVPAAGGSRPDRLAPVSGPQERVLRHTVEQAGDVVPGLPALDAPVPQMVDKLEDVLKIVDLFVPAQEIEVPRISSPSCPPPRRVLPVLQTAKQLVDVPLPAAGVVQAWVCDPNGQVWSRIWDSPERIYWWRLDSGHVQWNTPPGLTASPGRYINSGQGWGSSTALCTWQLLVRCWFA